jgi:ankyrin repeat protein
MKEKTHHITGHSAIPGGDTNPESVHNLLLWDAARALDLSGIMRALSHGANINIRGDKKRTILMHAIKARRSDLALALLNAGASLDPQDEDGETALMYAVRAGDADTARRLIDNGADILIENKNGEKPVDLALRGKNAGLAVVFEPALKELINRIPQGHLVWKNPVSPRERDPHGDTILTWAARHGQENVVRALMTSGADVAQKNTEGLTAEQVARQAGHRRIESLLKSSATRKDALS